jgi:protoporphyrinogen oxidase
VAKSSGIAIIGAGPTGIAAAHRLRESGCRGFRVFERQKYAGGLCASFQDPRGFTWDLGGHVFFSRHRYFLKLLQEGLPEGVLKHRRHSLVRIAGTWVPYPLQRNLSLLPQKISQECIRGLDAASPGAAMPGEDFRTWVVRTMGRGLARHFMLPYNEKVWACDPSTMGAFWVGERVSPARGKGADAQGRSPKAWGGNALFRYPGRGGSGGWIRALAAGLGPRVRFRKEAVRIDADAHRIFFKDRTSTGYDSLVSTMPLDLLVRSLRSCPSPVRKAAGELRHSGVLVVGIGIAGRAPEKTCWMYFPDPILPFFRVTYLSNYSGHNVPHPSRQYSLLCETSYSEYRRERPATIVRRTIEGLIAGGVISRDDAGKIVSTAVYDAPYAYPRPTLHRNAALQCIRPWLESRGIYSRGRFGTWQYELGNTDHAVMQGKEVADRLVRGSRETVLEEAAF